MANDACNPGSPPRPLWPWADWLVAPAPRNATVLEQLIQDADRAVTQGMNDDEFDHYFALQCNNE
jgi:hypothetical protein